jgi:hypothetical protein
MVHGGVGETVTDDGRAEIRGHIDELAEELADLLGAVEGLRRDSVVRAAILATCGPLIADDLRRLAIASRAKRRHAGAHWSDGLARYVAMHPRDHYHRSLYPTAARDPQTRDAHGRPRGNLPLADDCRRLYELLGGVWRPDWEGAVGRTTRRPRR